MDVLAIVKSKLPNTQLTDEVITMYIEEVAQSIKTYCNRQDIPRELKFVHSNITVDLVKSEHPEEGSTTQQAHGPIKSIKEGDTTIQYGDVSSASMHSNTDEILYNYKSQLNKFRKLRW